jgi:hypothetical protein
MMEAMDTMRVERHRRAEPNLAELFEETDSEEDDENVDVPETLHDFLILTIKGPQLDENTIMMLSKNGVEDLRSFLLYLRQSCWEMLSPLSMNRLLNLNQNMQHDIQDIKVYGDYIYTHDLVDDKDEIHLEAADPQAYQFNLRSH